MNKFAPILKDAFILFAVSTVFVLLIHFAFSFLEKNQPVDDPIVTAILQNDAKAVEKLAAAGPDAVNRTDEQGRNVLMRAAYANYSDGKRAAEVDGERAAMITTLVKDGARIDARDRDGWTPLMWASWSGMPEVAGKFLELGAAPNAADKKGNTPLLIAAEKGRAQVVKLLLAKGAAKTAVNEAHLTALDAAEIGMREYPGNKASYDEIVASLR